MEDVGTFYDHVVYLVDFSRFWGHLVYFMVLWYIIPVLVCCTKRYLATLVLIFKICSENWDRMNLDSATTLGLARAVNLNWRKRSKSADFLARLDWPPLGPFPTAEIEPDLAITNERAAMLEIPPWSATSAEIFILNSFYTLPAWNNPFFAVI
jgi:hypothetical protein